MTPRPVLQCAVKQEALVSCSSGDLALSLEEAGHRPPTDSFLGHGESSRALRAMKSTLEGLEGPMASLLTPRRQTETSVQVGRVGRWDETVPRCLGRQG